MSAPDSAACMWSRRGGARPRSQRQDPSSSPRDGGAARRRARSGGSALSRGGGWSGAPAGPRRCTTCALPRSQRLNHAQTSVRPAPSADRVRSGAVPKRAASSEAMNAEMWRPRKGRLLGQRSLEGRAGCQRRDRTAHHGRPERTIRGGFGWRR
eukprot:3720797-Rhodomonas_salina.3